MILRVFHGLPVPGGEAALLAGIREHAVPTLERLPALTGFQLGIRRGDPSEIVIVTTWTDFGAILASGEGQVDAARSIGGAPGFFAASHADHYELVMGDERGGPVAGAEMRVTTVTIKPGLEATYFDGARRVAARLEDAHGLVYHVVGRRSVADHTEVCAVTLWEPGTAVPDEPSRIEGAQELTEGYAAPPSTVGYEPVVQ